MTKSSRKNVPDAGIDLGSQTTSYLTWVNIPSKCNNLDKLFSNIKACPDSGYPDQTVPTPFLSIQLASEADQACLLDLVKNPIVFLRPGL